MDAADGVRVLLVEDDPAAQALMTAFLRAEEGVTLAGIAGDGLEGLEAIRLLRPQVVVLDLVLPRLSGLGLLQALAQRPPEHRPRILVLSRVNSEAVIQRCMDLGADFYLLKPVNLEELGSLILTLAGGRRREDPALRLLQAMGGDPNSLGCRYAADAARTLAEAPEGTLLKVGYYRAAELGRTSYVCVEKNIRSLVARLYEADTPAWRALWDAPPEKRPPNGAFLRRLARRLCSGG